MLKKVENWQVHQQTPITFQEMLETIQLPHRSTTERSKANFLTASPGLGNAALTLHKRPNDRWQNLLHFISSHLNTPSSPSSFSPTLFSQILKSSFEDKSASWEEKEKEEEEEKEEEAA